MEFRLYTAKNLDDAITNASLELGVTSDCLEIEVVEKGSDGFLGIGRKQAVIKARVKPEEPEVTEEATAEAAAEEKEVKEEKKEFKKEFKKEGKKEFKKEEKKAFKEEKKSFKEEKKYQKPEKKSYKEDKAEAAKPVERKEIELAPVEDVTLATCKKFIEDVLEAMDMKDVTVTASVDEEGAIAINMEGPGMGLMIGKRGQTLDSLQYLANRVANKMQDGYVRVKLDTENYRERRKKTLENLAKNIASKVKRTRRSVYLEPMNPYERRIIHSALQNDRSVSTHSEGEEPYRKVVVTLNRR